MRRTAPADTAAMPARGPSATEAKGPAVAFPAPLPPENAKPAPSAVTPAATRAEPASDRVQVPDACAAQDPWVNVATLAARLPAWGPRSQVASAPTEPADPRRESAYVVRKPPARRA